MTVATIQVPTSVQTLIDSRLDTIDRIMMGRVPRQERLDIVKEVEAQIFELLQARGADEPTREDVLAVLGRLDPPEAYLTEDGGAEPAARRSQALSGPEPAQGREGKASKISMVLGICMLIGSLLFFPLIIFLANIGLGQGGVDFFIIGGLVLLLAGSITGLMLAVYARLGNAWAVTGFVTGILAALFSLGFGILLLMS